MRFCVEGRASVCLKILQRTMAASCGSSAWAKTALTLAGVRSLGYRTEYGDYFVLLGGRQLTVTPPAALRRPARDTITPLRDAHARLCRRRRGRPACARRAARGDSHALTAAWRRRLR